jgi:photosystem II stability/assembly factor-like uncharacterized protein
MTSPSNIKGVILRTSDSGRTWTSIKIDSKENVFSQVYFSDINHGWLISLDNIYRTNDGGQSWKKVLKIPSTLR